MDKKSNVQSKLWEITNEISSIIIVFSECYNNRIQVDRSKFLGPHNQTVAAGSNVIKHLTFQLLIVLQKQPKKKRQLLAVSYVSL